MTEPILIWGAGAIGGCIGAHWARAGMDVLLVDTVAEHVAACRTGTGLRIEGPVDTFSVAVPALTPEQVEGRFSTIVLAVKAHHTAEAVAMLSPHLAEGGHVLSAQNGLNELTIAKAIGDAATVGAFVNFGADWLGPGQILYGNRGTVVVGELDGRARDRTHDMLKALRIFEPNATMTDNIWGVLWGKLAYGAMLFATALNDDSMAHNFATPARFSVWRTLGAEVMTAACTARYYASWLRWIRSNVLCPHGERVSGPNQRRCIGGLQPRIGQDPFGGLARSGRAQSAHRSGRADRHHRRSSSGGRR